MGLNAVQGPNCVQGPTWSLLKSFGLCWYQPKPQDSLLEFILLIFFFKKNKFGYSINKTTVLEPSFQIIFLIPKLPPMWPPLLLNFPIAFILSYIYLLLFYGVVSLQCFFLLISSNSQLCLCLSSQFFFLQRLRMIFWDNLFCLDPKKFWGTNVYKDVLDFLYFCHKDVSDFLKFHMKLFFFFPTTLLFQNFGAPSTWEPQAMT